MEKYVDPKYLRQSQYANPRNLKHRREIYHFSIPAFDKTQVCINALGLKGAEAILDVGCGEGLTLLELRQQHKHVGRLVGVDSSKGMFVETDALQKEQSVQPVIEFKECSADVLPFSDASFDVVLSLFMLYHMPDIPKALKEWARVLKNDGTLLVATNSVKNRPQNKRFRELAARMLKTKVPSLFSAAFNAENGEPILEQAFHVKNKIKYSGELQIKKASLIVDVFDSLRDMFPETSDAQWKPVLQSIKQKVNREITEKGYFSDAVERVYFVCKKK